MIGELYSWGSKRKSWDFSLNEQDKTSGLYNSEDWQTPHVSTHKGAEEKQDSSVLHRRRTVQLKASLQEKFIYLCPISGTYKGK